MGIEQQMLRGAKVITNVRLKNKLKIDNVFYGILKFSDEFITNIMYGAYLMNADTYGVKITRHNNTIVIEDDDEEGRFLTLGVALSLMRFKFKIVDKNYSEDELNKIKKS